MTAMLLELADPVVVTGQYPCSRAETVHIRRDDPDLRVFIRSGYSIHNSKVDLADERVNSCEPAPKKGDRDDQQ